jgi:hypothetical protein
MRPSILQTVNKLFRKIIFYPKAHRLRRDIDSARSLLTGPYKYKAFDSLGIYGFGESLVRIDFPPEPPASRTIGRGSELIQALLSDQNAAIQVHMDAALRQSDAFLHIPLEPLGVGNPVMPWRRNEFFVEADILGLLGILNHYRPKRFIEIGSGMSTRVARYASKSGLAHEIISIDPTPRIEVSQIADKVIRQPLAPDTADFILSTVQSGDIVFFDGSHRSLPGSDVNTFFLHILPQLPHRCIVHIHDIFLPYEYPQRFLPRLWSEQYMLATYLLADRGRALRPVLPIWHTLNAEPFSSQWHALGVSSGSSFWSVVA